MKFICALLSLVAINAHAVDPSQVYCKAYVYNDKTNQFSYADLTQAKYDKEFLEGQIGNYGLGADKYYMTRDGGIGLVITDRGTGNGTVSTAGWRTVSKTQMSEVHYYKTLKDGSRDQVTVSCYIDL